MRCIYFFTSGVCMTFTLPTQSHLHRLVPVVSSGFLLIPISSCHSTTNIFVFQLHLNPKISFQKVCDHHLSHIEPTFCDDWIFIYSNTSLLRHLRLQDNLRRQDKLIHLHLPYDIRTPAYSRHIFLEIGCPDKKAPTVYLWLIILIQVYLSDLKFIYK